MTNHKEIESLIQKKLDREITEAEMHGLKEHLALCPECRKLYEDLRGIEQGLRSLIEFFPAGDFNLKVLAELGIAPAVRRSLVWTKLTAVMAAAWIISLIGFLASPLPGMLLGKALLSAPVLVNFFEKISILFTGLKEIAVPFVKAGFNPLMPVLGAIASIIAVYALGKIIQKKEETCRA
jgi:anti-sigma factor RsiW